jgi:hypothetical protein
LHQIYLIPTIRERICRWRFKFLILFTGLRSSSLENVLHAEYSKGHFHKYLSFKGRVNFLVNLVGSLLGKDRKKLKLLSVGPRFESELYGYRGLGFRWKNIDAIDTYSYSPRIKVGNMHNIDYPNEHFNVVVCGWTLAYSNNPSAALGEFARILSSNGLLIITWDLPSIFDMSLFPSLTLSRRNDIDDPDSSIEDPNVFDLVSKFFYLHRLEIGKLEFYGATPFATLVLKKH